MSRHPLTTGHSAASPRPCARALLALGMCLAISPAAQAIEVVSTSPSAYALDVDRNLQQIVVEFDETPTLPPIAARVSGVMSGLQAVTTTVNGNELTIEVAAGSFFPGEMVRVNLHRNISGNSGSLDGGYYFAFTVGVPSGTGSWDAPEIHDAAVIPYFIHGGDMNEDDLPDLSVPNEGTNDVSVFLNQGDAIGDVRIEYAVGNKPSSVFAEDFDNDGDLDLATADIVSGTMSVLRNHGDGTFADAIVYPSGSVCRQVHGGDFDGDLDIDLATTSNGTDRVYLFFNQGGGGFAPGQQFTDVADGPFTIRAEDFDLDGHLDLAVGCQSADRMSILINDGTGTFSNLGDFASGNGPWDAVANDFDADGDCDLLTVLSFGNQIAILRNDGTGQFPTRSTAATDAFPLGVHAADVDGDGDIDAISSNFTGRSANLFANNGAGNLTRAQTFVVNQTGSYSWASDLDGDLDLDISIVDENSDLLFIFYQEGVPAGTPGIESATTAQSLYIAPQPMKIGEGTSLLLRNVLGQVDLEIVGPDGRIVREMEDAGIGQKNPVVHWDGRDQSGREVAPGRYFLRLRAENGAVFSGQVVAIR